MRFDPRNILVIHLGHLGDVVLSLPALEAIRRRFPQASICVATTPWGAEIVHLSGLADRSICVDKKALRDVSKLTALRSIVALLRDVRRAHFDFAIDLHSLSETNVFGYLSKAPVRLFMRRPGISHDWLSNFRPRPPVAEESTHIVDRYLDVLRPLGIGPLGIDDPSRVPRLRTNPEDDRAFETILRDRHADRDRCLLGLFPGARTEDRRWPLAQFCELSRLLESSAGARIVFFTGPSEQRMLQQARSMFPPSTIFFERLSVSMLASATAKLALFICNDTGPLHIAAAVGTPVVELLGGSRDDYVWTGPTQYVVRRPTLAEITTEEVFATASAALARTR